MKRQDTVTVGNVLSTLNGIRDNYKNSLTEEEMHNLVRAANLIEKKYKYNEVLEEVERKED